MAFSSANPQKRQDWVETIEGRVHRCIRNIELIRDCANPEKYSYTMADIAKVKAAIIETLDEMESEYQHSKKTPFKLGE